MIYPPRVLGYILREKQWAQLHVNKLGNVPTKSQNNPLHTDLLFPDNTKNLKDLVEYQTQHG